MNKKQIPCGKVDFKSLIEENCFYVDKTAILKSLFDDLSGNDVTLITRPRRFGKTLTMSLLNYFLSMNYANPDDKSLQLQLFKDTSLIKDTDFCIKHMGQYPVIAISFKDVDFDTFEPSYRLLASKIAELVGKFEFLLDSEKLSTEDKKICKKLLDYDYLIDENNKDILTSSLFFLVISYLSILTEK